MLRLNAILVDDASSSMFSSMIARDRGCLVRRDAGAWSTKPARIEVLVRSAPHVCAMVETVKMMETFRVVGSYLDYAGHSL